MQMSLSWCADSINNTTTPISSENHQCNCCNLIPQLLATINELSKAVEDLKTKITQPVNNQSNNNVGDIINEIAERQKRANNIIIYKLNESDNELSQVKTIIQDLSLNVNTNNIKIFRLGKPSVTLRPLKVTLENQSDALKLIKNRKKFREANPHLSISLDETPMQRKYFKSVKEEIDKLNIENNKSKVYYGIPKVPDIQTLAAPVEDEEEGTEQETPDKPKKKKAKKDPLFSKKTKSDPNAPSADRIPLPDLKDNDKVEKVKSFRESSRRITLGPETLPSICSYTLLNSNHMVTCAEVTEDSSMLSVGFSDSLVKVWTLVPQKLKTMKNAEQLQDINTDAEDVLVRMMDERSGETSRSLCGHSGSVYSVSFSPDRTLLLSSSEDGAIRLWSLQIWTCLVVYKGHIFPVWDVKFSPLGYYFATASHDRTARLWATDHYQPLRIFAGHFSDVDCIQFHPNANYLATGSSDRRVCLWDCVSGNHVRIMTGHKSPIYTLAFSICGRYLASGGSDCNILIWDLAHGHLIAEFHGHEKAVDSLSFSRCGNILASGSLDFTLKLWDFSKLTEDTNSEDVNISHNPDVKMGDAYMLRSFATKASPIISLHFTRRNLLLAVSMYDGMNV
ncbi:hypothetical protein FQA39_LY05075 [Lamprigera yunnana]|nr:hypothetical protein FQA39_LY05075 [Lamprigera yunnana]